MHGMAKQDLIFATEAWVRAAAGILTELAARHGTPGCRFSLCERFTNAPLAVAPSGIAAWHFSIDGRAAKVGHGVMEDADVIISKDYQLALPIARLIYTSEILAARAGQSATERGVVKGDLSKVPGYLVELHNRLAVMTL
jgi:hypothetical protein